MYLWRLWSVIIICSHLEPQEQSAQMQREGGEESAQEGLKFSAPPGITKDASPFLRLKTVFPEQ